MDYEKKYNEAQKRAEAAINIAADKDLVKGVATTIFPELRESEDERITRAINNMLPFIPNEAYANNGVTKEDVLNWLEKQKEEEGYEAIPVESTLEYKLGFHAGKEARWRPTEEQVDALERTVCLSNFGCDKERRNALLSLLEQLKQGEEKQKEQPTNEEMLRTLRTEYEKGVADTITKYEQKEQKEIPLMNGDADLYFDNWIQHNDTTKRGCFEEGIRYAQRLQKESLRDFIDDFPYSDEQKEQKPVDLSKMMVHKEPYIAPVPTPMVADEQKPASTEDMPYITDEHFYEREPADSFKYKLAEYMTKNCRREEGPYGYTYAISAESILEMAEEELLKRGVVQKPAEWSKNDTAFLNEITDFFENKTVKLQHDLDMYAHWLKSLPERFVLEPKQEWDTHDKAIVNCIVCCLDGQFVPEAARKESLVWFNKHRGDFLNSPSWKPREEQMIAFRNYIDSNRVKAEANVEERCNYNAMITLFEDLKKL